MVLADSHEISRAPCYSGTPSEDTHVSPTGLSPTTVSLPRLFDYTSVLSLLDPPAGEIRRVPQPRMRNARRLSHTPGLASSASAHHYSRNHDCFLFLRVLRCFTSPRSHHTTYQFSRGRHPMTSARLPHSETPGSQSGCRLPEEYRRLPRPSSAPDAKASTVRPQKLEHTRQNEETAKHKTNTHPQKKAGRHQSRLRDARVHCTVLKQQPAPHHPPHNKGSLRKPGNTQKKRAEAPHPRNQQVP